MIPADKQAEEAIRLRGLSFGRRMHRAGGDEEKQVAKLVEQWDALGKARESYERKMQALGEGEKDLNGPGADAGEIGSGFASAFCTGHVVAVDAGVAILLLIAPGLGHAEQEVANPVEVGVVDEAAGIVESLGCHTEHGQAMFAVGQVGCEGGEGAVEGARRGAKRRYVGLDESDRRIGRELLSEGEESVLREVHRDQGATEPREDGGKTAGAAAHLEEHGALERAQGGQHGLYFHMVDRPELGDVKGLFANFKLGGAFAIETLGLEHVENAAGNGEAPAAR